MVTSITTWTSSLNPHQKLFQNIYNTHAVADIAIYGYSDHRIDIIIEFTSKNCQVEPSQPGHSILTLRIPQNAEYSWMTLPKGTLTL
jgi:hypothetical protein